MYLSKRRRILPDWARWSFKELSLSRVGLLSSWRQVLYQRQYQCIFQLRRHWWQGRLLHCRGKHRRILGLVWGRLNQRLRWSWALQVKLRSQDVPPRAEFVYRTLSRQRGKSVSQWIRKDPEGRRLNVDPVHCHHRKLEIKCYSRS